MNSPKPLYKYLSRKSDGVADLVTKARFMGKLNQAFLKHVPSPVNLHVQLAHVHGSKLHVLADTPAWATKFRFMVAHLIPTLNKNIKYFQYVKEVTVSTRPLNSKKEKSKIIRHRAISVEAKSCLENIAEGLENKDLQLALRRLANRHKKS